MLIHKRPPGAHYILDLNVTSCRSGDRGPRQWEQTPFCHRLRCSILRVRATRLVPHERRTLSFPDFLNTFKDFPGRADSKNTRKP